ncbi:MAG: sugar phosphate nucleotidyltransferase [Patescibacteria group bacterium]
MQAVLLAAGQSTRFFPFNKRHKSLTKVMGEPIIAHTIKAINKRSGIKEFVVVTDPKNSAKQVLAKGEDLGVNIKYVVLEKPTGMGDALLAAESLLGENFFLVHSYHVDFEDIVGDFDFGNLSDCLLFLKEEKNISDYGVVTLKGNYVTSVVEKPEGSFPSNKKIVGVYFLKKDFISILKKVKPEHYSFEKALDVYAGKNKLRVEFVKSQTVSLKYPWDLLSLKNYLLLKIKKRISDKASVSDKAKIDGPVIIEDGAVVSDNAVIKGPCFIGKNVFVGTNSLVRDGTCLEENVKVGAFMEIKNSLVGEGSTFHSGYAGDSLIGRDCKIGSQFNTSNVRLDRGTVKVLVNGKKIDTNMKFLGAIIGDGVAVGGNVALMPGIIVGNEVNIGPSTTVMKNIPSNTVFYTKFKEYIEKSKS